jgi:hypothetical protein
MMKFLHRMKMTSRLVALFVVLSLTVSGCGSDSVDTPEVQSQKAMESAVTYLHQAGDATISDQDRTTALNNALVKVTQAYDVWPNQESLLMKGFVQIGLKKITDAEATLAKANTDYPGHSEDEFLLAYLNAQENRDTTVVNGYLMASYNDNFSGMDENLWYGLLGKLSVFTNFRTTAEYQSLLAKKSVGKTVAASADYVCKEDTTRYKSHWYGMEIDLSHKLTVDIDTALLGGWSGVAPLLGAFSAPVGLTVGTWLLGEWLAVKLVENKYGCGVKLHDTWLTIPIFIPTYQK